MNNMQEYIDQFYALAMLYGPKLLLAILTLVIGLWVIRVVLRVFDKAMTRADMEVSLQKFLGSLAGILLKALLLISVASMVGIATTSFVAILGAAGLAVGLALQGSLANFAGGVLILLFKPFKVGDVIDAQGYLGKVNAIQVFQTILKTPDNKTIIIPNGPLSNGSITNFSTEPTRRVDMTFGIGYDDNIADAKRVLQSLVDADTRIMRDPAPRSCWASWATARSTFMCGCGVTPLIIGIYILIPTKKLSRPLMRKASPSPSRSGMCICISMIIKYC